MTRGLGLVSLVVSLGISGMLFSSQLSGGASNGSSPQQGQIVQQANAVAASAAAMQAERELADYQAQTGTFTGATLTDVSGVTLLHAEPATFCLRIVSNSGVLYDAGPGGTPSKQPC